MIDQYILSYIDLFGTDPEPPQGQDWMTDLWSLLKRLHFIISKRENE